MGNINMSQPLVSCTVLSYNSSKTIIETLDSIAAQTYANIELIISDDCSQDNTIQLCSEWISKNEKRFVGVRLLTVKSNTGVCENSNRALAACQGKWQKGVAADDVLLPNCIRDFVSFVQEHPEAKWVSSYMRVYMESIQSGNCIAKMSVSKRCFFELTAQEQLKQLAIENVISAPANLYDVSLKRELGGYDSRYSYEDYPFFLTLLENGVKCYFMDKETVCYRIHESSSNSRGQLFNYKFIKEDYKLKKERCFKYLTLRQIVGQEILWFVHKLIHFLRLNKDTPQLKRCYKALRSVFRVIFFY